MDIHDVSSILLHLPLSLQCDVLSSWLTNTDVCKLDSAFCSKKMRHQYLHVLDSELMLVNVPMFTDLETISSWMEWVLKRKISITDCHVSNEIHTVLYLRFFKAVGKRLKRITLFSNKKYQTKSDYASMIATVACSCEYLSEIQIQRCTSLRSLESLLHACQESLTVLNLLWCSLTACKFKDHHLPSLKRLALEQCSCVSEIIMTGFLEASPNLEILVCERFSAISPGIKISQHVRVLLLSESIQLTDVMFCSLVHSCPQLEVVQLAECPLLTDVSAIELVQYSKHLTSLYLGDNSNFTDVSLETIAVHCGERLKHLCLNSCNTITDTGINHISEHCQKLDCVSFDYMSHISTAAVASVLRVNPLLREVTLGRYSDEKGDTLLTVLSTCCPLLVYCNIYELKGYTADGVVALVESCLQLRTIAVHPDCTVVSSFCRMLWNQK